LAPCGVCSAQRRKTSVENAFAVLRPRKASPNPGRHNKAAGWRDFGYGGSIIAKPATPILRREEMNSYGFCQLCHAATSAAPFLQSRLWHKARLLEVGLGLLISYDFRVDCFVGAAE
jgi:hypothetical protein